MNTFHLSHYNRTCATLCWVDNDGKPGGDRSNKEFLVCADIVFLCFILQIISIHNYWASNESHEDNSFDEWLENLFEEDATENAHEQWRNILTDTHESLWDEQRGVAQTWETQNHKAYSSNKEFQVWSANFKIFEKIFVCDEEKGYHTDNRFIENHFYPSKSRISFVNKLHSQYVKRLNKETHIVIYRTSKWFQLQLFLGTLLWLLWLFRVCFSISGSIVHVLCLQMEVRCFLCHFVRIMIIIILIDIINVYRCHIFVICFINL